MKSLRKIYLAATLGLLSLFAATGAWASREDTVQYLLYASSSQSFVVYYGGSYSYYSAYTSANDATTNLYYAWLFAPYGSSMGYYASLAQSYQSSAATYWLYAYIYSSGYAPSAWYYQWLAQYYTAYAEYYAAFGW